MSEEPRYWFRAKRYGWGWGMPSTWQVWVVLLAFIALLLVGGHWLLPALGQVIYWATPCCSRQCCWSSVS